MARKKEEVIETEPLKKTVLYLTLIGDTDLILHARSRYYEQSEVWKQSHDKKTDPPSIYKQGKNVWETLITSIHWRDPIEYHDEDISLYSYEEWDYYMHNNAPCILSEAFQKSFAETCMTYFKGIIAGATLNRGALSLLDTLNPITFDHVEPENKIVPTSNGKGKTSPVLCSQNVFTGWKCNIRIIFPEYIIPVDTAVSIVSTAGSYLGIGTQRANGYGKYHIGDIEKREMEV